MSDIRHPISALRLVITSIAILAVSAVTAVGQDLGPTSFRDSLVMRQIAYRAPCPAVVPRAWTLVDSTLGRGLRCSLVEAAARAIAQYHQARAPREGPADPWNPLCVRVVVGRNTGSTGLPGDWLVLFDLAPDHPVYVVLDRQTGEVAAVMSGNSPAVPRCLGRS